MARLIDADALMEEVYDSDEKHMNCVWHTSDMEYLVMAQPTVDAVPVVYGRWIYDELPDEDWNIHANCSVCGAGDTHAFNKLTGEPHTVPYCWKCGASMRERSEGE